jgi:pimeloyl-ACP methyl ester carboxylesterase/DNA-binding CsgD family transcriptional regulator
MRDPQHVRFCTSSDGTRLAYAALGSGPPLVKAPNWLTHLEYEWQSPIWRHWIEGLSRHCTFIRYDARGCGLSDREPPEISIESGVRDLEAVVDTLKLEHFPLLGISGGGAIAIEYATRHPERVSHLVLYGAYARGRMWRGGGQAAIDEAMLMCKLIELGWGTRNRAFRQVFATQFLPDASPEMIDAFDELQRESSSASDALRIMQVSLQVDVTAQARAVQCPTLIMHATDDGRIPFEEGRILAGLIPEARFVPLESRNHILLDGEPAWRRFLQEIEAFLPTARAAPAAFTELTARERELLEYLARGLDNHQIAAHLELSEKTIRNMVSSVFAKLGVESRSQAIVRARDEGFGTAVLPARDK